MSQRGCYSGPVLPCLADYLTVQYKIVEKSPLILVAFSFIHLSSTMSTNKTTASARGLLFDMDGTLLDSTPAVLATWEYFAKQYNLDLTEVLRSEFLPNDPQLIPSCPWRSHSRQHEAVVWHHG